MNFEDAIKQYKPGMYSIFNRYKIDGYDQDDLFQETALWLLRDWETITSSKSCQVGTSILSRAKWVCQHLSFYDPEIKKVDLADVEYNYNPNDLTDLDITHLLIRAKNRLSNEAYLILETKIRPNDDVLVRMKKETPTDRVVKKYLEFKSIYSYKKALNEVKGFLNDEDICSNRRQAS